MGKEIEIKLAAPGAAALEAIFSDVHVEQLRTGAWQEIRMVTEYLDTPDRSLAARKWMLRRRLENGEAVYTMKTPGDGYARGEWESRRDEPREAVRELVRLGAPKELTALTAGGVSRTCGVEFLRRTAELTLEGTRCALCLDDGVLLGAARRRPFCEAELELISGPVEPMLALADELRERYALREERQSKFVRAAELAGQP